MERRLIAIGDNGLAVLFRIISASNWTVRKVKTCIYGLFPARDYSLVAVVYLLGFHVVDAVAGWANAPTAWSTLNIMHVVNILTVVWIAPNVLRTFCLHFVTSNMHYYGDVELGNVIQQTQVLTPWWMMPFQLFCFNFGSTHAIHHFVVKEPFYIRQMTAPVAHNVMRDMGVRFNDVGTFKRANRWNLNDLSESKS